MSSPTPLQSFLGGIGLSLPVHALLLLNGNVFGISGFLHRAVRGEAESATAILGLVLGGIYIRLLEGHGPHLLNLSLGRVALAGFLVGFGSKLSNGCTSGHMICGLSRFSHRSIVATAIFFLTAALTSKFSTVELPSTKAMDWSLGPIGKTLLATLAVISALLSSWVNNSRPWQTLASDATKIHSTSRIFTFLITNFEFALALRLSNLTEAVRVLSFLSLPFWQTFDPSLAFLAVGALPTSIVLYQFFRGSESPIFGGSWSVPKPGSIDLRVVSGAALFGVGWGLAGICRPGLVNLGRSLSGTSSVVPFAAWVTAAATGGLFA